MKNLLASLPVGSWLRLPTLQRTRASWLGTLLLLSIISSLTSLTGWAQCSAPTNFSSWDWETPPYDANGNINTAYCNTWHANIATGSITAPTDMRAPWDIAGTPSIDLIARNSDFKKSNGWQLVRFDFGGKGNVTVPYFILYHRPTGVMRIYAYIANMAGYTGAVVTLSHNPNDQSGSGHSTATISTTNALVQAPDKYISQSATSYNQEQMTYVAFIGSRQNWTMAQFTMALDPRANDQAYQLNAYQIQIFGLVQSDVKLAGSIEFETQAATKDFSYGGAAPTPSKPSKVSSAGPDAQDIAVQAQKYLGNLATVSDKLNDIHEKADKFVTATKDATGIVKELGGLSKSIASSNVLKTIGSVAGQLGQLGGFFGLAGTVIGFFSDDASSKTSFVPTVSKGTITLSGTITTKSPLHTFYLLTPSTRHYDKNSGSTTTPDALRSQLPYNDCPTGIFNLQNTPVLQYAQYDQWTTEKLNNSNATPGTGEMRRLTNIRSYSLMNDVQPTVNANSGLEIISYRMAIAQKLPLSQFQVALSDRDVNDHYNLDPALDYNATGPRDRTYNFLYGQVASGEAQIVPYDPGTVGNGSDATVIYQTPLASCIGALYPFTTPTSTGTPYLRVLVTLHVKGTPADSAPVYYAQDYAVDIVPTKATVSSSTRALNARPDFQVQYDGAYPRPLSVYAPNITKTGNLVYDDYTFGKQGEVAFSTLLFDANSSITLQGGQNNRNIVFQASRSVSITGTLAIPSGFNVAITTDPSPLYPSTYYTCSASDLQYYQTNLPCSQDSRALRTIAPVATTTANTQTYGMAINALVLAPNPASASTLVQLEVADEESIQQLEVLNTVGQRMWVKSYDKLQKMSEPLSLSGFQTGVYIVRVTTSNRIFTSRLAVQ